MDYTRPILIAEDEDCIREPLIRWLRQRWPIILATPNGRKALSLIRTHKPELVILDILLEDMKGLGILSELRASPETANIPVIITSGLGLEDVGILPGPPELCRFISKPYDWKQLEGAIRALSKDVEVAEAV